MSSQYGQGVIGRDAVGKTVTEALSHLGLVSARPTARDALARHLYVYDPDGSDGGVTVAEEHAGGQEWDTGRAEPDDVSTAYRRADELLARLASCAVTADAQ